MNITDLPPDLLYRILWTCVVDEMEMYDIDMWQGIGVAAGPPDHSIGPFRGIEVLSKQGDVRHPSVLLIDEVLCKSNRRVRLQEVRGEEGYNSYLEATINVHDYQNTDAMFTIRTSIAQRPTRPRVLTRTLRITRDVCAHAAMPVRWVLWSENADRELLTAKPVLREKTRGEWRVSYCA